MSPSDERRTHGVGNTLLGFWIRNVHAGDEADRARLRELNRANMKRAWPWLLWLLLATTTGMLLVPPTAPLWLRVGVAAMVVPPLFALGWLRIGLIARMDELRRQIEYRAMAVALMLTLCSLLGLALLHDMHVDLHVPPLLAFWLVFGTHLLAVKYQERHYR